MTPHPQSRWGNEGRVTIAWQVMVLPRQSEHSLTYSVNLLWTQVTVGEVSKY